MDLSKPKVIVIAGPTASGKSHVALKIAKEMEGEIVNADSMQVYKYMDIGTAKATEAERREVPHHLLDVVAPDEPFNAAMYRSLALPVIEDIAKRGKTCLVVGGTGLYIKALVGGLFSCPPSDTGLRASLIKEWEELGPEGFHQKLASIDPESASKIHPHDKVRVTRAMEIYLLTGRKASELAQEHAFKDKRVEALKLCLDLPRGTLYERINKRTDAMVEAGLLDETKRLLEMGYSADLKPMKAIGYKHMVEHIKGITTLDEAIAKIKRDTRRYAKRQLTWFRADPEYQWVSPMDVRRIRAALERFLLE